MVKSSSRGLNLNLGKYFMRSCLYLFQCMRENGMKGKGKIYKGKFKALTLIREFLGIKEIYRVGLTVKKVD